jgi:integrase
MLKVDNVDLSEKCLSARNTKIGTAMPVFLPPVLVTGLANHPRGFDRNGQKLFKFVKCGRLYALLAKTKKRAGSDVGFLTFHAFRHTYATWMRRYAGADDATLIATGRWSDPASVKRYTHVVVSEESRRAIRLPVENPWKDDNVEPNPLEKKRA